MSDNSNQNNNEDKPELMSFAQRRAIFSQNLDQQNSVYRQPSKRRQSTPTMTNPPDRSFLRSQAPSTNASIVPPPATSTPPPAQQQAKVAETAKPAVPKEESSESIPSLSSSFKAPSTGTTSPKASPSEKSQSRVIWVKPDVKPANPLDSRNLTPDQILSNDEAFKIARERRKSDSAVLYAQKMALKQSSGDIPAVSIPPPPPSSTSQSGSPSSAAVVPPPSNPHPEVQDTEKSSPNTPPPAVEQPAPAQNVSDKSNQNDDEDKPELMSFAQRRAIFSQNLDQQNSTYRQPSKRRQSTPTMTNPPDKSFLRSQAPSTNASIVPPPATSTPPPAQQQAKVAETAKPAVPKEESSESIPSLSSSFKAPTETPSPKASPSEKSQGRVIWVKPDVKPANPLDSRNLTPDQILSNDEAFKIARERRKSDSAVLYAQKMALKQSSGDIPAVSIPPPPPSSISQSRSSSNTNTMIPPPNTH